MTRWIVTVVALAALASASCASAPPVRSFAEVPGRLKAGNTVRVTETTGSQAVGRVVALTPSGVTVDLDGIPLDIPSERVARIDRARRPIVRGAVTGLIAGLALGALGAAGGGTGSPVDALAAGASVIAGVGLGVGVGTVAGALMTVNETVYVRPVGAAPQSGDEATDTTANDKR